MDRKVFFKFFPTPKFLEMPAVGLDISDTAIRFVELVKTAEGFKVGRFGERDIPEPLVGTDFLASRGFEGFLSTFEQEHKLTFVNASLPEEKAYLFKVELPKVRREEIRSMLEFRLEEFVPLPAGEAVFDYDIGKNRQPGDKQLDLSVTVLPRKVVDGYLTLFKTAGFQPLSFEIEGQAIARAVIGKGDNRTIMIVNFSETRTTMFIVSNGVVNFSSTIGLGGATLTTAIKKNYNVSFAEAEHLKRERGFRATRKDTDLFFAIVNSLSVLRDEIGRLASYWRTHSANRGEEVGEIEHIILCGRDSGLDGFLEYFSLNLNLPVELANVWTNVCSFEDYIPPIPFSESLKYAAAVGLALVRVS